MFFEQWADAEALRNHFALPEARAFARRLRELSAPAAAPDRMGVYDAAKIRI
jgi:quinol monooxygenase YgiN